MVPHAVVLAGDLTHRIKDILAASGFHKRFTAKGRFSNLMASIPIRLVEHDEIGLFGAAAAAIKDMKARRREHEPVG